MKILLSVLATTGLVLAKHDNMEREEAIYNNGAISKEADLIGYAIEDEFADDWNWVTEETGEIWNGLADDEMHAEWNPWYAPYLILDFFLQFLNII
jgi:hypothetical protein